MASLATEKLEIKWSFNQIFTCSLIIINNINNITREKKDVLLIILICLRLPINQNLFKVKKENIPNSWLWHVKSQQQKH